MEDKSPLNINGLEQIKDPKERKKIQQKIRNRISAQNSRDRKKVYIQSLENEKMRLNCENESLQQQI